MRYKYTLEEAARIARDYVNEPYVDTRLERCEDGIVRRVAHAIPRDYKATLKEIRIILAEHRRNAEIVRALKDEHGEDYDFKSLHLDWTESHNTRIYTRKDGVPWCRLMEAIFYKGLNELATSYY